ncbi:unnamed protein product [Cunninghamella echinulata]
MSRVDVCTANAFLDDIHNTNEVIVKNLIKTKNLPGTSNEYHVNGNIHTIFKQLKASDFKLNNLNNMTEDSAYINKNAYPSSRGEPYIEYQQINEKILALIYVIIQFRLNLLIKNQAKKDVQLTHSGNRSSEYRKILIKDIEWEETIKKIKEQ